MNQSVYTSIFSRFGASAYFVASSAGRSVTQNKVTRAALRCLKALKQAVLAESKTIYRHYSVHSRNVKTLSRTVNQISSIFKRKNDDAVALEREEELFNEWLGESVEATRVENPPFSNPEELLALSALKKDEADFDVDFCDLAAHHGNKRLNDTRASLSYLKTLGAYFEQRELGAAFPPNFQTALAEAFERQGDYETLIREACDEESRKEFLRQTSEELCQKVRDLGVGDTFVYTGQIGKKNEALIRGKAAEFFEKTLPGDLFRLLFEADEETLINTLREKYADEYSHLNLIVKAECQRVHDGVKPVIDIFEGFQSFIASVVPESVFRKLGANSREDLLEVLFGKDRDEETIKLAEKIYRDVASHGLETALATQIKRVLELCRGEAEDRIKWEIDQNSQYLSNTMLLGMESLGIVLPRGNHFWIEIIKKESGKLTVKLVTSDRQGDIHPSTKIESGRGLYLPLVFDEIDPEKVSFELFLSLLKPQSWPHWNKGTSFCLDDVMQSLVAALGPPEEVGLERLFPQQIKIRDKVSDWLKIHVSYQEGFDLKKLEREFDFEVPYAFLVNVWPKVIKQKDLVKNKNVASLLESTCQQVVTSGVSLYKKGEISFDKLKEIYGSVSEVRLALKKNEVKRTVNRSMVIPPEIQSYIAELLQMTGTSSESIEIIQELCQSALGNECAGMIKDMIEELIPQVQIEGSDFRSTTDVKTDRLLDIFGLDSLENPRVSLLYAVKLLAKIIKVIRFVMFLSMKVRMGTAYLIQYVPQLSNTWIGAKGIALLYFLFGRDILELIIPSSLIEPVLAVFGLVGETVDLMMWRVGINLMKVAAHFLIDDEIVHSAVKKLRPVHSYLTRKGGIDVDVPMFKKKSAGKPLIRIPHRHTLERESIEEIEVKNPFAEFLSLPKPEEMTLTKENLTHELNRWLGDLEEHWLPKGDEQIEAVKSQIGLHFFHRHMRSLPLPNEKTGQLWYEIDSPEEVLEQLHELMIAFYRFAQNNKTPVIEHEFFESLVTMFSFYAIIDCLARRCPEAVIPAKFRPNGLGLMKYMGRSFVRFNDARSRAKWEALARYFDLDPFKKYDRSHEGKYLSDRFFSKGVLGGGLYKNRRIDRKSFHLQNDIEYFTRLLERPEIQQRLEYHGIPEDAHHFDKCAHLLYDEPVIEIESDGRRKGLLPRPFYLMRLSYFMSNELLSTCSQNCFFSQCKFDLDPRVGMTFFPPNAYPKYKKRELPGFLKPLQPFYRQTTSRMSSQAVDPALSLEPPCFRTMGKYRTSSAHVKIGNKFSLFTEARSLINHHPKERKRTQSQIMIKGPKWKRALDRPYEVHFKQRLEMVKTVDADRIIHCMSLFSRSLDLLNQTDYLWVLESVVTHPRLIRAALIENPRSVRDFGRFFERALKHFEGKNWAVYLYLCRVGIEFSEQCVDLLHKNGSHFPDFRAKLRGTVCDYYRAHPPKKRKLGQAQDGLTAALVTLVASYHPFQIDDISIDKREMIMQDIARLAYAQTNTSALHDLSETNEGRRALEVMALWSSCLKEAMEKEDAFRNQVLKTLTLDTVSLKAVGLDDDLLEGAWEGRYPYYNKGPFEIDLHRHQVKKRSFVEQRVLGLLSKILSRDEVIQDYYQLGKIRYYPEHDIELDIISDVNFILFKKIDGVKYRLIKNLHMMVKPCLYEEGDLLWIEEEVENPKILHFRDQEIIARYTVEMRGHEEGTDYQIVDTELMINGHFLQESTFDFAGGGLSLLGWFQPLSSLKFYSNFDGEKGKLARIEMSRLDLQFSVQEIEGVPRAVCENGEHAGFMIASEQKEDRLNAFGQYLIVENCRGKKKVLMPEMTLQQMTLELLYKGLLERSSSPFIDQLIASLIPPNEDDKTRVYGYSFEEGILTSQEPEAIGYLAILQICRGEINEALENLKKLETYGSIEPFSETLMARCQLMITALLLIQGSESEEMTLRLAALKERNRVILQQEPKDAGTQDLIEWLAVQIKYTNYLNRLARCPEDNVMSPFSELMVLHALAETGKRFFSSELASSLSGVPQPIANWLAENVVMFPQLLVRFNEIKASLSGANPLMLEVAEAFDFLVKDRQRKDGDVNLLPKSLVSWMIRTIDFNSLDCDKGLVEKIFHDLRTYTRHPLAQDLELAQLISNLEGDQLADLSTELIDLTPDNFKRHFLSFYRLALSDVYPLDRQYEDLAAKFKKNLPFVNGKVKNLGDAQLFELIKVLTGMDRKRKKTLPEPDRLSQLLHFHRTMTHYERKLDAIMMADKQVVKAKIEAEKKKEPVEDLIRRRSALVAEWSNSHSELLSKQNEYGAFLEHDSKVEKEVSEFLQISLSAKESRDRLMHKRALWVVQWALKRQGLVRRCHLREKIASSLREPSSEGHKNTPLNGADMFYDDGTESRILALAQIAAGTVFCSEPTFEHLIRKVLPPEFFHPEPYLDSILTGILKACKKQVREVSITSIAMKNGLELTKDMIVTRGVSYLDMAVKEATGLGTLYRVQSLANAALKGKRFYDNRQQQQEARKAKEADRIEGARFDNRIELTAESHSLLQQQEDQLNAVCERLFGRFFEQEIVGGDAQREIALYSVKSDDSLLNSAFERLNQSLVDYQSRPVEQDVTYRLKEPLSKVKDELISFQKRVEKTLADSRRRIEEFVNQTKRQETEEEALLNRLTKISRQAKILSFQDIEKAFAQNQITSLKGPTRLSEEQIPTLKTKMLLYYHLASRFVRLFDVLGRIQSAPDDSVAKILGEELTRRRVYHFDGVYEHLVKGKIIFETKTNKFLRQKQSEQIDKMLYADDDRQVVEMIPGSGKTTYGNRLINYFSANGDQAMINIWPAPVAKTNIAEASHAAREIFSQRSLALPFSRSYRFTEETLTVLHHALRESIEARGQINMTKENLQALELCFIECAFDFGDKEKRSDLKGWKRRLDLFRKILLLTKGVGCIDETHVAFDNRKELNHPIGKWKILSPSRIKIVEEVLLELLGDPYFETLLTIKAPLPTPLERSVYREKILPLFAEKMAGKVPGITPKAKKLLKEYYMGTASSIPDLVLSSPQKERFALTKGLLTVLLPSALEKTIHVDFNPSKEGNGEYARPSAGNDNPLETSAIQSPYEALVKTALLFAHDRLTFGQTEALLSSLKTKGACQAKFMRCPLDETPEGRFFNLVTNGCQLSKLATYDHHALHTKLQKSDRFVLRYVREKVASDIKYYEWNLSSNASNFGSMFASFYSYTGTPYNRGCYPARTELVPDPGTDGETIATIENRAVNFIEFKTPSPGEILGEIIEHFFEADQKSARALIDRGAALNGMGSLDVAKRLLRYIESSRTDIDGIAFYQGSTLMILEKGSQHPILFEASSIPPERRLSYFAQPQTYAADIPQMKGAVGLVTVGEDLKFNELAQAIWRMRGLNSDGQKLMFGATTRVFGKIFESHDPKSLNEKVRRVVTFSVINQESSELSSSLPHDYFQADKQKLADIPRRSILDAALNAPSVDDLIEIINDPRCKAHLIRKVDDDPFTLFGHIDEQVDPNKVIDALRTQIGAAFPHLKDELDMIGGGDYPKTVHVYSVDGHYDFAGLDTLDREVTVDVSVEMEDEQEQEVEQEQELEQELEQDTTLKGRKSIPQPYIPWTQESLDLRTTEWLTTALNRADCGFIGLFNRMVVGSVPPIYSLRDILSRAESFITAQIKDKISSSLYTTKNMHYVESDNGSPIEPFGPHQIPLLEALLILEKGKGCRLLLLTQKEAAWWRTRLKKEREEITTEIKYGLIDITTGAIVAQGHAPFSSKDLKRSDLKRMLTQLKFLRGDVGYDSEEIEWLKSWIQPKRYELHQYFEQVHKLHGVAPYESSDIHRLFLELEHSDESHHLKV